MSFVGRLLCVEVDTVGDSKEQVAVGYTIALSHPHSDTVASWVDHRLEVSGGVDPVVDGAPGGVDCTCEDREVVTEAVGIASVNSGLALLRGVMPCVAPVRANLGGVHQGFVDGQFRYPIGLPGLIDQTDYFLSYLQLINCLFKHRPFFLINLSLLLQLIDIREHHWWNAPLWLTIPGRLIQFSEWFLKTNCFILLIY